MIIQFLWTNRSQIGVSMKKTIIFGNKSKKIHAGPNQIYHFFQKKSNQLWFPLQQVLEKNVISLSMAKVKKLLKHGCSTNNNKRELIVMTIWQEYYLSMQNYTQKQDMFKAWMKFSPLFSISSMLVKRIWSMNLPAFLCLTTWWLI